MGDYVFVFGSNLAGRHGKGAALYARQQHGAIYGQGEGRQGRSYGIPIKDGRNGANLRLPSQTLSLGAVAEGVSRFLDYAIENPTTQFFVAEIGCGLAGYVPFQIAPLFQPLPPNVTLPLSFQQVLQARAAA